jgi:acyl dehydratase
VTAEDVERFAELTGDRNPLHFDEEFASRTRFGRLVAQGGIAAGLFNALVAMELPGPGSVFLHQEWDYPAPVFVGDTVTAEAEVIEARADKPITKLRCVARRQDGEEVLRGECLVYTMLPDSSPGTGPGDS